MPCHQASVVNRVGNERVVVGWVVVQTAVDTGVGWLVTIPSIAIGEAIVGLGLSKSPCN